MSFEIGLKDVYDKLCGLEDKWDEHWRMTSVKLAEVEIRLSTLEQKPARSAPWWSIAIAAAAVAIAVVALFVK